jgi:hypothetical protein
MTGRWAEKMNRGGRIVDDMRMLVLLFAPRCSERSTMDELEAMLTDDKLWSKGHSLFDRIRTKTLAADRARDRALSVQYSFEEICAKSLYNLSYPSDSFDADSPYWIVPNAFALARVLGIDEQRVLEIVAA